MHIIKLNATDSTNSYLKQLVKETSVPDGTIVISEDQQKGRGQLGNGWISRKGQSLTFSVFKRFERLLAEKQFAISMATSLAIATALKDVGVPEISVKWPNDILSGNKKIGGILIENVLEGKSIKHSVIGIGINVNETSFPDLSQASSLKLETGTTFNLEEIFQTISESVFKKLFALSGNNFLEIKRLYENELFRKGIVSVFEIPTGERFNGIIKGTADSGELLVEKENGLLQKFQLKEVKLVF